jgi:hypothetical protein
MTSVDAPPSLVSRLAWSFLVGALAMLTFHQAAVGLFPVPPFQLQPTGPLHVPSVVNGAFWSGLWGILFLLVVLPWMRRFMLGWAAGLLFGFVVPVAVLFLVVAPLRGQPVAFAQPLGSMLRIALAHVIIWQGLREPARNVPARV